MNALAYLRQCIRTVPDWPQAGVQFRDITPLLADAKALQFLRDEFSKRYAGRGVETVAGLESRGFLIGMLMAGALGVGFVPLRKAGKLPCKTLQESYSLEYGQATLEAHVDAVMPGQRVLLVDDLVATGGTLLAGARLLQRLGAEMVECAAVIDLPALGGSQRLREAGLPLYTLLVYEGH